MKKFVNSRLLSKRKIKSNLIGYARALDTDMDYLNRQIYNLNQYGCNFIFSDILKNSDDKKPQLERAFKFLSKGDFLIVDKLDRAFQSKKEFINTMHTFLIQNINVRTLSGIFSTDNNTELFSLVFKIFYEMDILEKDIETEKKQEVIKKRKIIGENLGGRPKISALKESLVLRLRDEGCSYRTIRSQTGVALSTIRRIILDAEIKK